jgi:glucose dehydrogenase
VRHKVAVAHARRCPHLVPFVAIGLMCATFLIAGCGGSSKKSPSSTSPSSSSTGTTSSATAAPTSTTSTSSSALTTAAIGTWPRSNYDLSNTRDDTSSPIDAANVSKLHVVWQSPIKANIPLYGGMSSAPIVVGGKVYLQDMKSDAFALNASTGKQLWTRTYNAPDEGVNGL